MIAPSDPTIILWFSLRQWEEPQFDKLDDLTCGPMGPGHGLIGGEEHGRPEWVVGIDPTNALTLNALAYLRTNATPAA